MDHDDAVRAVLVDLDDTVFPQEAWLRGAWRRVADTADACGIPGPALFRALEDVSAEGSDRGYVIDRALDRIGVHDAPVPLLVSAFRDHVARELEPYPGVREALSTLRAHVRVGLVTDGEPAIQRSKLSSLGLEDEFDAIVISDEYGRHRRKPDPYPLLLGALRLRTDPSECIYIGDRPDKDVVAADNAGMRSIRVLTGEYAAAPDVPCAWRCAPDLATAIAEITSLTVSV